MKKTILLVALVLIAGCGTAGILAENYSLQQSQYSTSWDGLEIDGYGPGVHKDKYGRPVTVWPDFGGVHNERLQIKEDAYGPGVHIDQYGRSVRGYPWP